MTLREGDRETYYAALDRHFPGLKQRNIHEHGILSNPDAVFDYLGEFPHPEEPSLF